MCHCKVLPSAVVSVAPMIGARGKAYSSLVATVSWHDESFPPQTDIQSLAGGAVRRWGFVFHLQGCVYSRAFPDLSYQLSLWTVIFQTYLDCTIPCVSDLTAYMDLDDGSFVARWAVIWRVFHPSSLLKQLMYIASNRHNPRVPFHFMWLFKAMT